MMRKKVRCKTFEFVFVAKWHICRVKVVIKTVKSP